MCTCNNKGIINFAREEDILSFQHSRGHIYFQNFTNLGQNLANKWHVTLKGRPIIGSTRFVWTW